MVQVEQIPSDHRQHSPRARWRSQQRQDHAVQWLDRRSCQDCELRRHDGRNPQWAASKPPAAPASRWSTCPVSTASRPARSTSAWPSNPSRASAASLRPDALILVADAANLRTHLHTILQMKSLGLPVIVALNMIDLAERDGVKIDVPKLSAMLGVPVVATRATRKAGRESADRRRSTLSSRRPNPAPSSPTLFTISAPSSAKPAASPDETMSRAGDEQVHARHGCACCLHPVAGSCFLFGVLFVMFQAVFAWATPAMDAHRGWRRRFGEWPGQGSTNELLHAPSSSTA
jgi:hypothetical protein